MSPTRRFGLAIWTLPALIVLGAACASTPAEPVGEGTGAFTTQSWVDGNVLSFKPFPSNIVPGLVYVLGTDGNLWREIGSMSNRTWVDGNVLDYQPIDENVVYVLGTDGNLWREVGSMSSRTPVWSGVSAFQVASSGAVYVLDSSGTLRLVNDPERPSIPSTILAYTVRGFQWTDVQQEADDGTWGPALYVLRSNGTLWRADPEYTPTSEALLDTNVSSFRALGGMDYFAETTDSKLWFEHNTNAARALVDANVQGFWGLNGQTVFVEDGRFNLWREQFSARDRDLVDANVKAFRPAGADSAYVLRLDGNLYFEQLTDPVCKYEYAPRVCLLGIQNETYVAAWGAETASGTCPVISTATGKWKNMVGGYIPGVPTTATDSLWSDPPPPKCEDNGLPSNCCWYVWWPKAGAIQDPSALCTPNNVRLVAFDVCGKGYPKGGSTGASPGGGGCSSCRL